LQQIEIVMKTDRQKEGEIERERERSSSYPIDVTLVRGRRFPEFVARPSTQKWSEQKRGGGRNK
jgi:hypothetical protein